MRVRVRAVGLKDARSTGVVVTLVSGDNKEGVALVNAIILEAVEEGGEGGVVCLELRLVVGFPRPGGAREVRIEGRWEGGRVVVVRVRDVGVGHRYAGFLHLGNVAEGVRRECPIEAGKSAASEWVRDWLTVHVIDAGIAAGDRRVDIFGTVERLVARVATRLIRKLVRSRIRDIRPVRGADAAALSAVDRDANVVRVRLGTGRCPGRCRG